MDPMQEVLFSSLDLEDPFFRSLRDSYDDFERWFKRKSDAGERTLVAREPQGGKLIAMLYLKTEDGIEPGVTPELSGPRLKIGTFKVDLDHHTSLGKRLLAIALRRFAKSGLPRIYVTMHDNDGTRGLRRLLKQYGFNHIGMKRGRRSGKRQDHLEKRTTHTGLSRFSPRRIKSTTSLPSVPNIINECLWNGSELRRAYRSRMKSAPIRWRSSICRAH